MPNIQDQQTPEINSSIDVPSIVTSLNTQTGPEARPADFGADMSGLAQGLDDAYGNIYRAQREEQGKQAGKDELWAAQQHALLDQKYTQVLGQAELNGQPIMPNDFQGQFQKDTQDVTATAPTSGAAAAFTRGAVSMEDGFFHQTIESQLRQQMQQRSTQIRDIATANITKVNAGSITADDALANILAAGRVGAATNTPGAAAIVSNAGAQIVQAGIKNVAQNQGPGAASLAVRGGYGGAFVPPVTRETLATTLDNQQSIAIPTRQAIATQNVNALSAKAAAGGTVAPADAFAAATELANASQAVPVDTRPPALADVFQSRMDHYADIESKVTGRDAETKLEAMKQIESHELVSLGTQRLNTMSPADMRLQIDELSSKFGETDPLVQHMAAVAQGMTARLTPGSDKYDPAGVAMQNPSVQAAMSAATAAATAPVGAGGATGPSAAIGMAQGSMKTAVESSFTAQRLLGVQPGQEHVLTKQQTESYGESIQNPADAEKLVNNFQNMYGQDYANRALKEVFTSKGQMSGSVSMALMNPNNDSIWAAAQYKHEGAPLKDTDPISMAVTKAITGNATWNNYRLSQKNDLSSAQRISTMEQALPGMTEFYVKQNGMTPDEAVNHVIDLTLGSAYSIAPTGGGTSKGSQLSVPSAIASTPQDIAQHQIKANLIMDSLIRSHGIGSSNGEPGDAEYLATQAVQNGYWSFDNSNQTYTRMYDTANGPTKVALPNGQPIALNAKMIRDTNLVTTPVSPMSIVRPPGAMNDLKTGFEFINAATGHLGSKQSVPGDPTQFLVTPQAKPDNSPILSAPEVPTAPIANPRDFQDAGIKTTHYGYSNDSTPDKNSTNGIGAFANPLTPGAVALSPSMESKMGAKPGDVIEMRDAQGNVRRGYFADRTSQNLKDDRVDLYDPHGSEEAGSPFTAVSFVNRGGGRQGLGGRRLSAQGEMALARLEEQSNG